MSQPVYLKPWLQRSPWLAKVLFVFIMLSGVFQFGAFALSQNFVIGYLGAQPEDVTFALQMAYVGILIMLPIQFRLQRRYETRSYLITVLCAGIALAIACMFVVDIYIFMIIRFFQGMVVCGIASCMLVQISPLLKAEYRQAGGTAIFFGAVLSNTVLIGLIAANVTLSSDFQQLYRYIIFFLVVALLIVIAAFKESSGMRPYPLWQIDWVGGVFFVPAAVALAFTIIYGSKYYWFADQRIQLSSLFFLLMLTLFVIRELTVKRPLVDLRVLRKPNIWFGLLVLALYYGIKESINLIFGYTGGFLQWSPVQTMKLGLFNIAGLISFMVISVITLSKKPEYLFFLFFSGFLLLFVYHLWVYYILTPDLAFVNLIVPIFLQGAASGIMFVPIVAFIVKIATPQGGSTGLVLGSYARFISLLNVSAGFYNLQLHFGQLFRETFLSHLQSIDLQTAERLNALKAFNQAKGYSADTANVLANSALAKVLAGQAQLLSLRATFRFMAILSAVLLGLMLAAIIITFFIRRRRQNADIGGVMRAAN